jgi:hypothetical protein
MQRLSITTSGYLLKLEVIRIMLESAR